MKKRLRLQIEGVVQGVGFRPFVYCLATELQLNGWVNNSAQGVLIEVEGQRSQLEMFLSRLQSESPPLSRIDNVRLNWFPVVNYREFCIKDSTGGEKKTLILPDIATCADCLGEILEPSNRRYRYPFTNCTNCGSRYSILEGLPYDRPQTTMKEFTMCNSCLAEYRNPRDRRFHAQPNACADCGPHVELWDRWGNIISSHGEALRAVVEAIRQGKILAIKGLGGFHLVVDAGNETAIQQLRNRKKRPHKPFALIYPNLKLVQAHCHVSLLEEKLLLSPEAPIVLLKRLKNLGIVDRGDDSAPPIPQFWGEQARNPYFGVMLPYTPLHHFLLRELGFPIVATSGNLSGEPICIDNREALQKLNNIADLFLVHDRPIARPLDDSIVRVMAGREQIIRRARGYAPLPIPYSSFDKIQETLQPILATGGQLKNAIAFLQDNQIFLSQYIGNLESVATSERFKKAITDFQQLYEIKPAKVVCDLHPHYLSTQYAQQLDIPLTSVQHHYAHVLSCMVDNNLKERDSVLGVAWDGTGYGLDGTIWGGEFLQLTNTGWHRMAHLQTFPLPGGKRAIKEPRRIAIALLYQVFGEQIFLDTSDFADLPCITAFTRRELAILQKMLRQNINTPLTSSMGRLFDGVAAILGIRQYITYEGQAAIELEYAMGDRETPNLCRDRATDALYDFNLISLSSKPVDSPLIVDWRGTIREILLDLKNQVSVAKIATKFHNTLVEIIIAVAERANRSQIILTGGCFQNKYLTEIAIARLQQANFTPYWHHHIPCNDGGIAIGQILVAISS